MLAALAVGVWAFAQPMSGTYKVGVTDPASDYVSLSAAVAAINANGVGGNIVLEITSDITEPANIGLGVNTNGFGITIRPDKDEDRTITFTKTTDNASPSGHFVIGYTDLTSAWADANTIATNNVTIDGYAVGSETRRLKFTTESGALTASRLIMVIAACENTTIKNCIVESKSTSTSALCIGTIARKYIGAGDGAPNGVLIENNIISSVASLSGQGLMTSSSGTLVSAKTTGLVVKDNVISAQGRAGWFYHINGGVFDGNEIKLNQLGNANTVNYGLWTGTGTAGSFTIRNNKFFQLTTMEATATGTLGLRGLSLSSGANYDVYNNTFAGLDRKSATAATVNLTYIFFGGTGSIYNNTFYMPALTQTSTPGYYNAIQLSFANPNIVNNIFISEEDAVVNAFYSAVSTSTVDYNVFYNRAGTAKSLIVAGTTNNTLALHQTANPTKDVNSKNVNVNFVDAATGNLLLTGASLNDANLEVPRLPEVLKDILGFDRGVTTYAGAHQPDLTSSTPEVQSSHRIMRTSTGVMIELDRESVVEIYGMNGVMIDKTITSGTYSRDLNQGIYVIRIDGQATKFLR